MAITPRHFLDFINHFVKLYAEKRSGLEEEQLHLNVGLNKIAETVGQVEEMQKSLAVKSAELQVRMTFQKVSSQIFQKKQLLRLRLRVKFAFAVPRIIKKYS